MSEEKFDQFLRRNAPAVKPPPWHEKDRIWRAIENVGVSRRRMARRWVPAFSVGLIVCATTLFLAWPRPSARDAQVEKVLSAALQYDLVDAADSDGF